MTTKKLYYGYGEDDGALIEVEVVDLGPEVNKQLANIYQQPTNLTELDVLLSNRHVERQV